MWGNKLGWGISAAIFVLALILCGIVYSATQITAPTNMSIAANLEPLSLPITTSFLNQTESGDAGDLYRQAIDKYNEKACNAFIKNPTGAPPESIALVLQAAHKSSMDLFLKNPAELVNYQPADHHLAIIAIQNLGRNVNAAGMVLLIKKQNDEAKKYFQAAFALGWNLFQERVCYEEYLASQEILQGAMQELIKCEPASSQSQDDLTSELSKLQDYDQNHVQPICNMILNINQNVIAANAGDVYEFADKSKDRMFRVEAILKLGRYRFDARRTADQVSALRYIKKYLTDPDPAVATAAQAAQDLTKDEYDLIR